MYVHTYAYVCTYACLCVAALHRMNILKCVYIYNYIYIYIHTYKALLYKLVHILCLTGDRVRVRETERERERLRLACTRLSIQCRYGRDACMCVYSWMTYWRRQFSCALHNFEFAHALPIVASSSSVESTLLNMTAVPFGGHCKYGVNVP